jgi:DNA polymerase III epsilon subunit-like protein
MTLPTLVPVLSTLLICDSETSGLPDDPNVRLIEAAAVWWSIDLGTILATWSELVEGTTNEAEGINKIPPAALAYGLARDHALQGLRSRADRADAIIAHRKEFDQFFLGDLGKTWICSKNQIEWGFGVEPGASLLYTASGLGVPIVEQHRALTDCILLAKCFEVVWRKSGPDGVREMLRLAMRPRSRYVAQGVPYEKRQLTKDAHFRWNGDMKSWWKDLVDEDITKLPFQVRRVPEGSTEYVGLAKG